MKFPSVILLFNVIIGLINFFPLPQTRKFYTPMFEYKQVGLHTHTQVHKRTYLKLYNALQIGSLVIYSFYASVTVFHVRIKKNG